MPFNLLEQNYCTWRHDEVSGKRLFYHKKSLEYNSLTYSTLTLPQLRISGIKKAKKSCCYCYYFCVSLLKYI